MLVLYNVKLSAVAVIC